MSDRAGSAARIMRLRRDMARLAEWRRLKSERRVAELEAARQELDAFVGSAQPQGLLAQVAFAQAGRLEQRRDNAKVVRDRDLSVSIDAQRKLKTAERVADALARAERDRSARADLEKLIEAVTAVIGPASLP